jgi:hypothetical protein
MTQDDKANLFLIAVFLLLTIGLTIITTPLVIFLLNQ